MASGVQHIDNEEKTTVDTLITILARLRARPDPFTLMFEYSSSTHDAIPIAHALLDEGYDPNGMSNDLWTRLTNSYAKRMELLKFLSPVGGTFSRVTSLRGFTPRTPLTWDDVAERFEHFTFLDELTRWTRAFYVDMLLNMRDRGRTPTPTNRSTASRPKHLKRMLLDRDGWFSVVGGIMDDAGPMPTEPLANGMATLHVAHIIPFSASRRIPLRHMLSKFAGQDMENLLTGQGINDPSNALLLDPTTRQLFDAFKFGLECQNDRYFLRMLVPRWSLPQVSRHFDGEELLFGQGPEHVALPSALLCNIRLAVGRVLRACGAAETIDKILQDEEDLSCGNLEGDYGVRVGASYLERELRALQGLDELAIDGQEVIMDSEEDLSVTTRHIICA
ncbi:hypothetical protein POJ06DRAFT_261939 [Lipomyces tetrasporus]|uniref:HNH nuclease domain-containing protein n=1 Tax=Lipomyces tetrasporus TaxID=54092 RepID=A0AAD7VQI6_9ASCO|nr:uncharacterized protein POJ06DRAFT_261939 [Lipomyces tetrasporus]KAJ8097629.1 hypothetical protein POJ06DRAFT_261939 [Lipomyces tetrasporus]